MYSPLMITPWSLCSGRSNSETPMSLNWFLPAGSVAGISFLGGAFALLDTGSVASTNIHVPGVVSRKQPAITFEDSQRLEPLGRQHLAQGHRELGLDRRS